MIGYIQKSETVLVYSQKRELFTKKEPFAKVSLQVVEIGKKLIEQKTKDGKKIPKESGISVFFKKNCRFFYCYSSCYTYNSNNAIFSL
jgi:hypothetical protein